MTRKRESDQLARVRRSGILPANCVVETHHVEYLFGMSEDTGRRRLWLPEDGTPGIPTAPLGNRKVTTGWAVVHWVSKRLVAHDREGREHALDLTDLWNLFGSGPSKPNPEG